MRIVVVTGLSGGGKTTALRALEDLGFYCCDNLPAPLFESFIKKMVEASIDEVAISCDARQLRFIDEYAPQIDSLRQAGHEVEILYLEAADAVLIRRYSETRRRHPLSGEDILDGIRQDREALKELRKQATVINTGGLNVHEVKAIVNQRFGSDEQRQMVVKVQSFGYKHGVPADSTLVFDVRFLVNPHFDPVLRPMDGRDRDVRDFVFATGEAQVVADKITDLLRYTLPLYQREGKSYITVSIGCTGGRHRSVALVEEICTAIEGDWQTITRHRDLERGTV